MNESVREIYIYWLGLSKKHHSFDIKGLPTPIPIKSLTGEKDPIIIKVEYFEKHCIAVDKKCSSMREIANGYRRDRLWEK